MNPTKRHVATRKQQGELIKLKCLAAQNCNKQGKGKEEKAQNIFLIKQEQSTYKYNIIKVCRSYLTIYGR